MKAKMKIVFIVVLIINTVLSKVINNENPSEEEITETEIFDDNRNNSSNLKSANLIHQNDNKPWLTRCCGLLNMRNCSQFEEDEQISLENLVYDKTKKIQVPDGHFKIVNKKNCDSMFKLEEEFNEKWYLQANGHLYHPHLPNQPDIVNTGPEAYCLDFLQDENDTLVVDAFLCITGPVLDAVQSNRQPEVYLFGMMISMPFLLMTFLVYACIPELQNIHGKCLMCYVASLLFALIFLVSVQLHTGEVDPVYCVAAPCIVYFFFMVSFMWLNVMCIDICWTFSGRRGFKGIRNSERKRFVIYNIYAWGIPLVMLIITIALQLSTNLPDYIIRPNFGEGRCWFKDDNVVGYYFYGPIILIILVNCGLFIYTAAKIYLVQRDTDQSMKQESSQRHGKETDQQRYKLYLKLMMVFGINWSMEILSWAISGPAWLWYVTDMFNALYGVLIFFIFVCKANVWKLVRKRYYVLQGKPMQGQTIGGPTSSTRSTAMSHTVTSGAGGNGPDSFALTGSNSESNYNNMNH